MPSSPTRGPLAQQAVLEAQLAAAERLRAWRDNPRSKPFASAIEAAAGSQGVPVDLLGALIERESQFDPNAVSPAGAVGLAQLMPIHHGEVNPRDPAAATAYSAKYLAQLNKRFGNWDQALAAYNYGQGNVAKAIRARGQGWKDALPEETRNYIEALGGI